MSADAKTMFDAERAQAYDRRVREAIPGYEALHQLSCMVLAEVTGGHGRALVAGAGTGGECIALAQACPGLQVVGVDPAADMLAHAERKVAEHGLNARVRLYPSKVSDLPKFEPFDAATLLLVLHFLPDDGAKLALLTDIAQHLKPGAPWSKPICSARPGTSRGNRNCGPSGAICRNQRVSAKTILPAVFAMWIVTSIR